MQFSPTSCHFIPLRSKYSPQHPVLKHPQSVVCILEYKFTFCYKSVYIFQPASSSK
jgi:hypothetical protein